MNRPGRVVHRWLAAWCSPETMTRIVEPAVADMQSELGAADGKRWKRTRVSWRGYTSLAKALVLYLVEVWWMDFGATTPADRTVLRRALVGSAVVMAIATVGLAVMPSFLLLRNGETWRLVAYLMPQAMAVSIPLGLLFGILRGTRGQSSSPRVHQRLMVVGLLATVGSFALLGWVVPAANQEFRQKSFEMHFPRDTRPIDRGLAELTLPEMAAAAKRERAMVSAYEAQAAAEGVTYRRGAAAAYFLRLCLSLAPVVLVLAALFVAGSRPQEVWALGAVGAFGAWSYFGLLVVFERGVRAGDLTSVQAALLGSAVFLTGCFAFTRVMRAIARRPRAHA